MYSIAYPIQLQLQLTNYADLRGKEHILHIFVIPAT